MVVSVSAACHRWQLLPFWLQLRARLVYRIAYLAGAAAASTAMLLILLHRHRHRDIDLVKQQWMDSSNITQPTDVKQRSWDQPVVNAEFNALMGRQTEAYHRARLMAAAAEHSGDWLNALPITSCGLRLDNEAVRVAVGLRLGCSLCQPHQCPCGAMVDTRGSHALSCRFSAGRQARHDYVNDLIYRAI